MDFYTRQSATRRQSALLLIAFVLVLLAMGVLIHLVITTASIALGQSGSYSHPSKPALAMIALVWLTMIAGSVFRIMDVRAGGAVLARRFGAVHASDRSRYEKERQLLNVVAEMSIASFTSQPDVFVLRHERSINAFVLGNSCSRPVIVLTDGALEAFSREQLQAVVAHEFSHISNGDLAINMRLLTTLGGLMAIDEVGRILLSGRKSENFHPGMLVGGVLCALGTVGVITGKLIASAYSRQREYLADATAVQFTRNPFALAQALDIVRQHSDDPALHGVHARELVHLCFQSGCVARWLKRRSWLSALFASHPDIALRIKAIEPHFEVKHRSASRRNADTAGSAAGSASMQPTGMAGQPRAVIINAEFGQASGMPEMDATTTVPSDRIILLLPDESMCLAALFALFVNDGASQRREYLSALSFSFNDQFTDDVRKVMQLIPHELATDQLGVINHISDVLNERLSVEQRQKIALKLEQLLSVNGSYQLMDYARIQLIRRKLLIEFPVISTIARDARCKANGRKAKSFDAMGREFALLLSLMVESSGASAAEVDKQFKRVLTCYTQESYPRRTACETGIIAELEAAFQTLYVQPYSIRHAFVQHCVEIMQQDGIIMPNEKALLDLFAASLGCESLIAA